MYVFRADKGGLEVFGVPEQRFSGRNSTFSSCEHSRGYGSELKPEPQDFTLGSSGRLSGNYKSK